MLHRMSASSKENANKKAGNELTTRCSQLKMAAAYEEALARLKRSLEIKRDAEKRIAEEWFRRGLTGTIVSL